MTDGAHAHPPPHGEEAKDRLAPRGLQTARSRDRLVLRDGLRPPQDEATWSLDPAALFKGLHAATGLILAVSGGADSMALLLLAARWADRPPTHVATVDHGLRPESAGEAALVARQAADLGFPHSVLAWQGAKPSTRIQERARAARYALLADHARVTGASHILTAHHADDQAETVLMRLGRGSGIGGLAGMRRETPLGNGLILCRPLLDVPKADLVALCRMEGIPFVDDPSNRDHVYARARLRAQSAALAAIGLDRPALTRLARRMARADAALETEAARIEASLAIERHPGGLRAHLAPLIGAEPEILLRVLRRAIESLAGRAILRLDRLETLTDAIANALRVGATYRATLAGLRIVLSRDTTIAITPEAERHRGKPSSEEKGCSRRD